MNRPLPRPNNRTTGFFRRYGLFLSHILNWVGNTVILVLSFTWGRTITPNFHEFSVHDITLKHSYHPESTITVPVWLLASLAVGFPLVNVVIVTYSQSTRPLPSLSVPFMSALSTQLPSNQVPTTQEIPLPIPASTSTSNSRPPPGSLKAKHWAIFYFATALLGSQATQLMIVCVLKNICGLPRPDMLARCQPDLNQLPPASNIGSSTIAICNPSSWGLSREGFRSFPSGHSSTIFASATLMTYYNSKKFRIFNDNGILEKGLLFKSFTIIFPSIMAIYVSFTRVSDNRHFVLDVVAGAAIGTFVGVYYMKLIVSEITNA